MFKYNRRIFKASDLVSAGPAPNCSPLLIPGKDKVRLNSGGPLMSVENVDKSGQVLCTWKTDGKVQTMLFPSICVRRIG